MNAAGFRRVHFVCRLERGIHRMKLRATLLALTALLLVAVVIVTSTITARRELGYRKQAAQNYSAPAFDAAASEQELPVSLDGLSNRLIGWGPGVEMNDKNQPTAATAAQNEYGEYGATFIKETDEKVIYLTYDLGYENGYTETILDAMLERGVKGIFFVTRDYLNEAPDIVRRIIDEGHVLANHSWTHPSMPSLSLELAELDVTRLHERVLEEYGYKMTLFRFPRGEFSARTLGLLQNLGYESVFWSFAYVDWLTGSQPDPTSSLKKLIDRAHPGAIYLLHAVSSTNAAIVGDFIDEMHAQGYRFDTFGGPEPAAQPDIVTP